MTIPKWVTPERQAYLAKLAKQSQGYCIYGHTPCFGKFEVKRFMACKYGLACNNPQQGKICPIKPTVDYDDIELVRKCEIVDSFKRRWHCGHGDKRCNNALWRVGEMGNLILEGECYYPQVEARLIKAWSTDDRQQTLAELQTEAKRIHKTYWRDIPLHGTFSGVSKDIWYDRQSDFYIEGYGVSGVTFKPFVRVRIASTQTRLYIDLAETFKPLSKHVRRKAIRYRHIKVDIQGRIDLACLIAVNKFRRSKTS